MQSKLQIGLIALLGWKDFVQQGSLGNDGKARQGLPEAGHEEANLPRPSGRLMDSGLLFCIWTGAGSSIWRLVRWTIEIWPVCGCRVGPTLLRA